MKLRLSRPDEDDEIDLTPMIDCIFQLVLFFMVTASFIEEPPEDSRGGFLVSVNKPGTAGKPDDVPEKLTLLVEGGLLVIDPSGQKRTIELEQLADPAARAELLKKNLHLRAFAVVKDIREAKQDEAHGYKITLPRADKAATIARADTDRLTVTHDGKLYFGNKDGGDKVESLEALLKKLRERVPEDRKRPIVLRCDAKCEYRLYVQVKNVLKLSGVETFFEEVEVGHDAN